MKTISTPAQNAGLHEVGDFTVTSQLIYKRLEMKWDTDKQGLTSQMEFAGEGRTQAERRGRSLLSAGWIIQPTNLITIYCLNAEADVTAVCDKHVGQAFSKLIFIKAPI